MPRKPRRKIKDIAKSVLPEKNAPHVAGGVSVFIMSALVLQLILFLLHFMIYETLYAAFGLSGLMPALILGLLSLTFIVASLLAATASNAAVRTCYRFSVLWFSFVAPLCGACAAFAIIENLLPKWGLTILPFPAGIVCFGAAVLVTLYGIWNSGHLRVTNVSIRLPKVPDMWRGKHLVFISDVHLGNVRAEGFAKKIVEHVKTLGPAAVVIGGDLFDGMKCDALKLTAPFKELRPPLGIYFVSGNHEYIRDSQIFFAAIRAAGITILRDEKVDVGGMDLIGVDWNDTDKRKDYEQVLAGMHLAKGRSSILVRHVPDNFDIAERAGISLQLSGHVHQGQFWPISLITHYFYHGFDYGLRRFGGMPVYTTSGVGTWMSPFRFGTKAEIVAVEFIEIVSR